MEKDLTKQEAFILKYGVIIKLCYIGICILSMLYLLLIWEEIKPFGWVLSIFYAVCLLVVSINFNAYLDYLRFKRLRFKVQEAQLSSIYNIMEFKREI